MNNRILRILFIVFSLSAHNLMAEDINIVFNSVQELPIKHNQESEIIWDFRNVIITGESRMRFRNFGDSILDQTNVYERNDFFQKGDSIFITGFENYKYNFACTTPQYISNRFDLPYNTQNAHFTLDGKAYLQYPVHLSAESRIEKPIYGTVFMPTGDSILNVRMHHEYYSAVLLSNDSITITDSITRNIFKWYIPESKIPIALASYTYFYVCGDSIPLSQNTYNLLDFEYNNRDNLRNNSKKQTYSKRNNKHDSILADEVPSISTNNGLLNVSGITEITDYKLYISDLKGRIIIENIAPGYNIGQLLPGQYIVWLECKQGIISKNFSIK